MRLHFCQVPLLALSFQTIDLQAKIPSRRIAGNFPPPAHNNIMALIPSIVRFQIPYPELRFLPSGEVSPLPGNLYSQVQ
jgi:hypothetical protein